MRTTIAFDRTWCAFFASIGLIRLRFECYSHTPMIRQQLWPFWANLSRRWHLLCDVHMSLFLLKIWRFWNNLHCRSFMPKTCIIKFLGMSRANMSTSIIRNLSMIRRLSKIVYFTALMFSSVVDVLRRPGRVLSLISSRSFLNRLYHNELVFSS